MIIIKLNGFSNYRVATILTKLILTSNGRDDFIEVHSIAISC